MSGFHNVRKQFRLEVFRSSNWKCFYCGCEVSDKVRSWKDNRATIDHKVPLAEGGGWHEDNLICACRRCNNLKGDMKFDEFVAQLKEEEP